MPPDAPAPPEDEVAALRAAIAERDQQIANANARLAGMEETYNALRPPPANPNQIPPGKKYVIPPHIRQQIAGLGLTDAEIEKNGDLIVPFLHAYLGQTAQEMLTIIRQQADDVQQFKMLRQVDKFPHADQLFDEVTRVREEEAKAGRYMPVDVAYRVALANNYDKIAGAGSETTGGAPGGQFGAAGATTRAASAPPPSPAAVRSRDVSMGSALRSVRAPVTEPAKPVTTGTDLLALSREERKAFFEQNKETPIR
jgi:hypothetical protein